MKQLYLEFPIFLAALPAAAVGTLRASAKAAEHAELDSPVANFSASRASYSPAFPAARGSEHEAHQFLADRFSQWLKASESEATKEEAEVETDNHAFLAVGSALVKRRHDAAILRHKLVHAVKWGQDLSKLFQSSAERERRQLHELSENEFKKDEEIRAQAKIEVSALERKVANQSTELQAQTAAIEELRKELAQSRQNLDRAREASTMKDKQLQREAAELKSREQEINRLRSLVDKEDSELNATRHQSEVIVGVARGKIAQARAGEKRARDDLEREQQVARAREIKLVDRFERADKELAVERRHEQELQQQVNDLEALVRGDTLGSAAKGEQATSVAPAVSASAPSAPVLPKLSPATPTTIQQLVAGAALDEQEDGGQEVEVEASSAESTDSEGKLTGAAAQAVSAATLAPQNAAESSTPPARPAAKSFAEHSAYDVSVGLLAVPADLASALEG